MMKTARSLIVIFCLGAVLAVLIVVVGRMREVHALEVAVQEGEHRNAALVHDIRAAGIEPQRNRHGGSGERLLTVAFQPSAASTDASLAELQHWLGLHPEKSIPEIGLVPEGFSRAVAATIRPGSDPDLRQGARMLRHRARQEFGERAARALADYAGANAGSLPASMADLAAYFDLPMEESILRRYQVLAQGGYAAMNDRVPLIGEVAGVDDDFDSVLGVSRTGLTRVTTDRTGTEIQRALHRYLGSQGGKAPADTAALIPYLTFPINGDIVSKYVINSDFSISEKK